MSSTHSGETPTKKSEGANGEQETQSGALQRRPQFVNHPHRDRECHNSLGSNTTNQLTPPTDQTSLGQLSLSAVCLDTDGVDYYAEEVCMRALHAHPCHRLPPGQGRPALFQGLAQLRLVQVPARGSALLGHPLWRVPGRHLPCRHQQRFVANVARRHAQTGIGTRAQVDTTTHAQLNIGTRTQVGTTTQDQLGIGTDTQVGTVTHAQLGIGTRTQVDTDNNAQLDIGTNIQIGTAIHTDTGCVHDEETFSRGGCGEQQWGPGTD